MNQAHTIKNIISILTMFLILFGCSSTSVLPKIKYSQYEIGQSFEYKNDTLIIKLRNTLQCPIRIWFSTTDEEVQKEFKKILPITLNSLSDTILTFGNIKKKVEQIQFASRLGDTKKEITPIEIDLPFPKNRKYTVIQENNSNFTHNTDWSKYAIDFNLKTNDTICSATDGYVVGIVDKYKFSGIGSEWKDYGNYLTIYDPKSGIFTQYVHLVYNGSLVKLNDNVKRGQSIGLAGNTGQSTGEHLHFSSLIPINSKDGLISIPTVFSGGIKGIDLKKGQVLNK